MSLADAGGAVLCYHSAPGSGTEAPIVWCVRWDGEQRAQQWRPGGSPFTLGKDDLPEVLQGSLVWIHCSKSGVLSLWIFISFGCLPSQLARIEVFYRCSWQMWSFLTCHWCCKNQIDKMLECRILLFYAPICFLLIFLFLHSILYFFGIWKRQSAIACNHKLEISALSMAKLK